MRKLLIAVSSESLAEALTRDLQNHYHIYSCSTGVEALSLIEDIRPDALIIYLSLPDIGGLAVLRQANYKPPIILAISNFINESVMQTAGSLGIQCIVPIPCSVKYIADCLKQIETLPTLEV